MSKNYGFSGASAEELREAYDIFNAHLKQHNLRDLMLRGPIREADMRKAFRKLALMYHPDRNPGNEAAMEERQKQVFYAFNLFKNYFAQNELYDPATFRSAPGAGRAYGARRPSAARPQRPSARPSAEDPFWQRGSASLRKDQEFYRMMEQYSADLSPAELEAKLAKSLQILWRLLEQSGSPPEAAEQRELRARRLASRYNLQAELSYAQRRYDKAKIEYLLEAVYLIWEDALQGARSDFDVRLLATGVKNALVRAAKSAFYDGKGNTKALWLLSQQPRRTVELVRERLGLEAPPAWSGVETAFPGDEPRKGFFSELTDLGADLKHTVLRGLRKIINP
jgi:curved DNA-binding protein CbpA